MNAEHIPQNPQPAGRANGFVSFMASPGGRLARLTVGAGLMAIGVFVGPPVGYIIAAAGLLPVASGALNLCPVSPAFGGSFRGGSACKVPAEDPDA